MFLMCVVSACISAAVLNPRQQNSFHTAESDRFLYEHEYVFFLKSCGIYLYANGCIV